MARGNNKMRLFWNDRDYLRLLGIVGAVLQDYDVDCWAYCLMPNHYHLVWRTRQANLSEAVRQLNGTFAQWWNKQHRHVGHVFQGRFKAQIVEDNLYLLRLCRYVLLNPVRGRRCATPDQWRWSSYRALITGVAEPSWIDGESLLQRFETSTISRTRERLIAFVHDGCDDEMAAFVREDVRIIGSGTFAARFETHALAASSEVPAQERRVGSPSLAMILASSLEAAEGLDAAIARAHHHYEYSIADIARCTRLSPTAVARLLRRQSGLDPVTVDER
jgi:putative transposase